MPGSKDVALSAEQRASLQDKLEKFGNEVVDRAKKMKGVKEVAGSAAAEVGGESKAGNQQQLEQLKGSGKRGQYASRYRILETSYWKKYTAEEDVTPWELLQGDKMKSKNEFVSDLPGYHIFLAKLAISVDK